MDLGTYENWFGLKDEIKWVAKFFLLKPEYREPFKMLSRHSSAPPFMYGDRHVQPWLSKEDYLSVQTFTRSSQDFFIRMIEGKTLR